MANKTHHTIHLHGHASPQDTRLASYRLLPFQVPEGIARLEVRYSFSGDAPGGFLKPSGNVLDIGLFDPRGSEFLHAKGFRGWSGSARRAFFLSAAEATPGYLPGPILPGRWEIILGLYRIHPPGCSYQVTITLYSGESPDPEPSLPSSWPALRLGAGWYRGDLHCHTHHSDASGSLADLVAAARAQQLDFVAVTDHNTVSHLPSLAARPGSDLLLIAGEEITTEHGHANAWGIRRWHDFRCETPGQMAQVVADVKSEGALISVNHPKDGGPPWRFGDEAAFDCLEVWQAPWFVGNEQSLALWDRLLRQGHRITGVGGSDIHQAAFEGELGVLAVGKPCTWVYAEELSVTGILAGIRAGRVFISEDAPGPRLFLTADPDGDGQHEALVGRQVQVSRGAVLSLRCHVQGAAGCRLWIQSADGATDVAIVGQDFTHTWTAQIENSTFFRAEVSQERDPGSSDRIVRALSNPIWVKAG